MNQQMLKNIYEALGELRFRYHGQMMHVVYDEPADTYTLEPVYK